MCRSKLFADRSFTGIQLAAVGISSSLFAIFVYMTFYLRSHAPFFTPSNPVSPI